MPATIAVPESGRESVVKIFTVVDLPAPLGPSSPKTEPASTERLRPFKARTDFPYVFVRSFASMAGAAPELSLVAPASCAISTFMVILPSLSEKSAFRYFPTKERLLLHRLDAVLVALWPGDVSP